MIRRILNRMQPFWLLIRCTSLAFRERHRLVWCAACHRRAPKARMVGVLTRVDIPNARVMYVAWTCLDCWQETEQRA